MKLRMLGLTLVVTLFGAGCTQVAPAVKGIETGPGGWQSVGERQSDMRSDVEYLGASADGLIIVRTPDGRAQVWKR